MELIQRPNYVLDAQTKEGDRMTSFALEVSEALLDFQGWVEEEVKIESKDLWYADIFTFADGKHYATVTLNDKSLAIVTPAPEDSKVRMFKRNRFIAWLKGELR